MSKLKTSPVVGITVSAWIGLACLPSAGPGPQRAQPGPVRPASPAVEAELRASPPTQPASAGAPLSTPSGTAEASSAPSVSSPPVAAGGGSLECLQPPDPELDQESPWSRELGQRLEQLFPRLRRCTLDLPSDDAARITLRLVYAKDGSPISQHVVTSTSNACAASECLEQELANVHSPRLYIDKASIDLTLALAHDAVPERVSEPVDPLTPDEAPVSANGCVDPEVARLSQSAVREIVSGTYDELQRCYSQALTRNHSAAGKVNFEFVIGQNGSVDQAWASDATLHDCAAIECMLTQFRGLRFPEPVGRSVRVIYPISYVLEPQAVTLR
jgi:hypothetical protein